MGLAPGRHASIAIPSPCIHLHPTSSTTSTTSTIHPPQQQPLVPAWHGGPRPTAIAAVGRAPPLCNGSMAVAKEGEKKKKRKKKERKLASTSLLGKSTRRVHGARMQDPCPARPASGRRRRPGQWSGGPGASRTDASRPRRPVAGTLHAFRFGCTAPAKPTGAGAAHVQGRVRVPKPGVRAEVQCGGPGPQAAASVQAGRRRLASRRWPGRRANCHGTRPQMPIDRLRHERHGMAPPSNCTRQLSVCVKSWPSRRGCDAGQPAGEEDLASAHVCARTHMHGHTRTRARARARTRAHARLPAHGKLSAVAARRAAARAASARQRAHARARAPNGPPQRQWDERAGQRHAAPMHGLCAALGFQVEQPARPPARQWDRQPRARPPAATRWLVLAPLPPRLMSPPPPPAQALTGRPLQDLPVLGRLGVATHTHTHARAWASLCAASGPAWRLAPAPQMPSRRASRRPPGIKASLGASRRARHRTI